MTDGYACRGAHARASTKTIVRIEWLAQVCFPSFESDPVLIISEGADITSEAASKITLASTVTLLSALSSLFDEALRHVKWILPNA